jgi:hypothetical protein
MIFVLLNLENLIPEAISSLPIAIAPIRHASETDGAPDTHKISFNKHGKTRKAVAARVSENVTSRKIDGHKERGITRL